MGRIYGYVRYARHTQRKTRSESDMCMYVCKYMYTCLYVCMYVLICCMYVCCLTEGESE